MKTLANLSNRTVIFILVGIALISSIASLLLNIIFQADLSVRWWVSWLQNFSTEMFGAFLTFVLIELIVGGRERRNFEKHELMDHLLHHLTNPTNGEATAALDELHELGWLTDGSLKGKYLGHAELKSAVLERADLEGACLEMANLQFASLRAINLQGANLRRANLRGAKLTSATMQEANLVNANLAEAYLEGANLQSAHIGFADIHDAQMVIANLQKAYLEGANLEGANLSFANLKNAHLEGADLKKVKLQGANLEGVCLSMADLEFADLSRATFDEHTVLPDQTHWSPAEDMRRFTEPSHPAFWRSENPCSPAYHQHNGHQMLP